MVDMARVVQVDEFFLLNLQQGVGGARSAPQSELFLLGKEVQDILVTALGLSLKIAAQEMDVSDLAPDERFCSPPVLAVGHSLAGEHARAIRQGPPKACGPPSSDRSRRDSES
jgi:hypothetical protein